MCLVLGVKFYPSHMIRGRGNASVVMPTLHACMHACMAFFIDFVKPE